MFNFCVAYTKCVATSQHDQIYLFVHESRAPVTWFSKPHMYALRTYFFFLYCSFKSDHGLLCVSGMVCFVHFFYTNPWNRYFAKDVSFAFTEIIIYYNKLHAFV